MSRFDDIDQDLLTKLNETVAETATRSYAFLRFVWSRSGDAPDWKVGTITVTGAEAVACVDEATMGWVRYVTHNGKTTVVEEGWVPMLGNKKPPRPNSFTDKSKWEKWPDGSDKDPWSFKTKVPLKLTSGELAGKVVLFTADNVGGRFAIGELQVAFAEKRRRPLVELTMTRSGNSYEPAFRIIRFVEDDSPTPGLLLAKDSTAANATQATVADAAQEDLDPEGDDISDDLPF